MYPTPRRRPSPRSTSGNSSSPPFGPAVRPRGGSASRLPRLSALGCLTSLTCAGPSRPSADCCGAVREDGSPLSPSQDTPQISRGQRASRPCIGARLIQPRPGVDGGRCGRVPARPDGTTPRIGCVALAPHVRSTRPSDPTSRWRPGASRVLRLHAHLDGGLSPPRMTACTAHTPAVSRAQWRERRRSGRYWASALVLCSARCSIAP
jgi:hypothetical protein